MIDCLAHCPAVARHRPHPRSMRRDLWSGQFFNDLNESLPHAPLNPPWHFVFIDDHRRSWSAHGFVEVLADIPKVEESAACLSAPTRLRVFRHHSASLADRFLHSPGARRSANTARWVIAVTCNRGQILPLQNIVGPVRLHQRRIIGVAPMLVGCLRPAAAECCCSVALNP